MSQHQPQIYDTDVAWRQTPEQMDDRWATGWRHFGPVFFRYSSGEVVGHHASVWPLRLALSSWALSKSQRRITRKNTPFEIVARSAETCGAPAELAARQALFHQHKQRFSSNVPESLTDFLGPQPGVVPCQTIEFALYDNKSLVAASYLDVGSQSVSSVYAYFDPAYAKFGLGIYTMLVEMNWAQSNGFSWYYPGYAYDKPSVYDYKKRFNGLLRYDWAGSWVPCPKCVENYAPDDYVDR